MPQLNPAPWLAVLAFTWLAYLAFLPYKLMYYTFPNEPSGLYLDDPILEPWNWPWF